MVEKAGAPQGRAPEMVGDAPLMRKPLRAREMIHVLVVVSVVSLTNINNSLTCTLDLHIISQQKSEPNLESCHEENEPR